MTTPPEVVRILASSTVFVNASSRVNLDFAGMMHAWTVQLRITVIANVQVRVHSKTAKLAGTEGRLGHTADAKK